MTKIRSYQTIILLYLLISAIAVAQPESDQWTDTERMLINSLSLDSLGPIPPDPSNRYAENSAVAKFGEKLFNDPRFSLNGKISCASCHKLDYNFTDELALSKGIGVSSRRSMPAVGMAFHRWFFWDGRTDSLWAQALAPLENEVEHAITRTRVVQLIYENYKEDYQAVISQLPDLKPGRFLSTARPSVNDSSVNEQWLAIDVNDREKIITVFVNVGKAIAAYVRTLTPEPSAFDIYARALMRVESENLGVLTSKQKKGLRLFIGKAKCVSCHNGPLLTNGEFHHIGVPDSEVTDFGRAKIINTINNNEFSCLGRWSDADKEKDCAHVRFMDVDTARYLRAFKTPSLRNVAIRAPYMHAGQFKDLLTVIKHYRDVSGTELADEVFHNELSDDEINELESFLHGLTSLKR